MFENQPEMPVVRVQFARLVKRKLRIRSELPPLDPEGSIIGQVLLLGRRLVHRRGCKTGVPELASQPSILSAKDTHAVLAGILSASPSLMFCKHNARCGAGPPAREYESGL